MLWIGWSAQPIDADGPLAEGMGRTMLFQTLNQGALHQALFPTQRLFSKKSCLFEQAQTWTTWDKEEIDKNYKN